MAVAQHQRDDFDTTGRESYLWLSSARMLKKSADILYVEIKKTIDKYYPHMRAPFEEIALFKIYMLLCGLAFENLLKGILVGREPEIVSQGTLDKKKFKASGDSHDLNLLAHQVTALTDTEKHLFTRLTEFTLWAGRYPIPMNVERMVASENLKGSQTTKRTFMTSDPALIDDLFQRFSDMLENERPK